ncbi:MAG: hypothetical protein M0R77_00090 [Gammaproteobacteria bacterium]|nr:hypothetical protein [Acholeplasmataceae bacterium]MCK9528953.1 hypothetical protein [Gammaproteobacteria bacterium]
MSDVFLKLANLEKQDDLSHHTSSFNLLGDELKEALNEAKAEQRKAVMREAVNEIIKLDQKYEACVKANVENIRAARKAEAQSQVRLKELNRAKQYAMETQNFLPLAFLLGVLGSNYSIDAVTIPEDWKSVAETPKKKAVVRKTAK